MCDENSNNGSDNQSSLLVLELTTEIVSAYLQNNNVTEQKLPELIREVYRTLQTVEQAPAPRRAHEPAVPIEQSITEDALICLEDGKKFKSLKRHLRSRYDLTPDAYREKWGLPHDYPMVAPAYARRRSKLAKEMGLGKQGK
ncbi:MAG: MucR family transcriptional regulator [Alphaproteobacteria bacterium]|nr:MucR family transcriptional regulator [Alphaproteobacteria bacterium]